MTTIIFHIGVREPPSNSHAVRELLMTETEAERAANRFWAMFKRVTLYQTAVVYMCSRITVNMTLVITIVLNYCFNKNCNIILLLGVFADVFTRLS